MNLLPNEESTFERVLSILFPPVVSGRIDHHSAEYHGRMSRTGIEPVIDYTLNVRGMRYSSDARIMGPAQEKRVISLPGRVV